MSLSLIAQSITGSPTLGLNKKFAILKANGEPVIHLGGGEPKSKVPIDAINATIDHLKTREVRYTPVDGIPPLKNAIIEYTEEFYNRTVDAKDIMASGGAKQAIMIALQAILNPGEEVIFPAPYWVSYPEMVKLCGAKPVPAYSEDESFYPKLIDITKNVNSKTKAVIINSPNNPTGAMYSEEFIAEIVEYCAKKDIYLIMDDIYHRLIFDGKKQINPYKFEKKLVEESKLIVINGVSKQFAMTGFRLGWAVANKKLIEAMTNIQGHQTSGPSVLSQKGAIGAIEGDQLNVETLRLTLEKNRNILVGLLNSLEGVKVTVPDGTFYCFANFNFYDKDSNRLSELLIDRAKVLTVPGTGFGLDGHLRISFCGSEADITEGIRRIKWALDRSSPDEINIGEKILVRDWV
jgi:aspartate aminotransferase